METPVLLTITSTRDELLFYLRRGSGGMQSSLWAGQTLYIEQQGWLEEELASVVRDLYYQYWPNQDANEDARRSDPRADLRRLEGLGERLYRELFPVEVQEALAELAPETELVLATNVAGIPWELAYDGQDFLGMRWRVGREGYQGRVATRRRQAATGEKILFIVNPTGDLPEAQQEVSDLIDLFDRYAPSSLQLEVLTQGATKRAVQQALESGEYRLIHYSGHAVAGENGLFGLQLADKELSAREIQLSLRGQPWVVLNACNSAKGTQPHSTQGDLTQGDLTSNSIRQMPSQLRERNDLTSAFLKGGAPLVLGTLWAVPDIGARNFIVHFYTRLLRGETVGAALQKSRQQHWQQNPGDPIWSAYVLHGQPGLRLLAQEGWERQAGALLAVQLGNAEASPVEISLQQSAQQIAQKLALCSETVAAYGGDVVERTASGLLALFGPLSARSGALSTFSGDEAERALAAALAMRAEQQTERRTQRRKEWQPEFGMGLAGGVIIRSRATGVAVGPVRKVALWLAGQARGGQILADEEVFQGSRTAWVLAPWTGAILPSANEGWALHRVREVKGHEGLLRPLVAEEMIGRREILESLDLTWQQACKGNGRIWALAGEAGIGKSHFVELFVHQQQQAGYDAILLHALGAGRSRPYGVLAQLLRHLAVLEEKSSTHELLAQIEPRLTAVATQKLAEMLATVELVEGRHSAAVPENAVERRGLLVEVVGRLLEARQRRQAGQQPLPLLLVIDDFHHTDELSLEVLQHCRDEIRHRRLLLLVTHRPEWPLPDFGRVNVAEWQLGELTLDEATELVSGFLSPTTAQEVCAEIAGWVPGNPLFLREAVRSLRQRQILIEKDGRWDLPTALPLVELPGKVEEVILGRLALLSDEAQAVAQKASILGTEFAEGLLEALLTRAHGVDEQIDALAELATAEFLLRSAGQVKFSHAIIQRTVYESMPPAHRRLYHQWALAAWSSWAAGVPPIDQRAYHAWWSIAELVPGHGHVVSPDAVNPARLLAVVEILHAAGADAVKRYAMELTITYYQQSLAIAAVLTPREAAEEQTLEASSDVALELLWSRSYEGLGDAYLWRGNYGLAELYLQEALRIVRRSLHQGEWRRRAADLARRIGRARMYGSGPYENALAAMDEGLALLAVATSPENTSPKNTSTEDNADLALAALIEIQKGAIYQRHTNLYDLGQTACESGLALAARADAKAVIAEGHNVLGALLDARGRREKALEHYAASAALYTALGDRVNLVRVNDNRSTVLFYLGNWDDSFASDWEGLHFWKQIGEQAKAALLAMNIGEIYKYRGQWQDAEDHLRQAESFFRESSDERMWAQACANLGSLWLLQGRYAEAQMILERGLTLVDGAEIPNIECELLCWLGEVALESGAAQKGLAYAERAHLSAGLDDEMNQDGDEGEEEREKSLLLRLRGLCHLALGEAEIAEKELLRSLQLATASDLRLEEGQVAAALVRVYRFLGRTEAKAKSLARALELFESLGATPLIKQVRLAAGEG